MTVGAKFEHWQNNGGDASDGQMDVTHSGSGSGSGLVGMRMEIGMEITGQA